MEKKLIIEELEKQCFDAEKTFKALSEQLAQAKKTEEEAKRARLEAERQERYNEIVSVYKHFEQLRSSYVDDYGYFTFSTATDTNDSHSWFWKTLGLF